MKKISFMIAAFLVAMTGCQKEPQAAPENNPGSNAETVGYVALKISLPSSTGTRAADTAFDDGDANEYAVNDVTVVFYDDAGNYKYHASVDPKPWNKNGESNDNITVTGKTPAIEVQTKVEQALVLVNINGMLDESTLKGSYSNLNSALDATTVDIIGADKNRFFMSNEPRYVDGKFTTLVPVSVASTESQALAMAQNVKVERAAAKVTVDYYEKYENVGSKAVVVGWNLDVTNKSFYPVRQGFDSDVVNEWFPLTAGTPANESIIGLSRIYWAKDPNYAEGNITGEILSAFNRVEEEYLTLTDNASAYCLENTFNTGCMNENQTTTVMLKVNYMPEGIEANETWFQVGTGKTVYSAAAFVEYLKEKVQEVGDEITAYKGEALLNAINGLSAGPVTNFYICEQAGIGRGGMAHDYVGEIICYKDGICYYPVKVRHFTDEELGYDADNTFRVSFEANGYATNDLGRYGVLRNTWYNITVNSITNPGSPVIPDPTDKTDDKFEQFVACTIDILAWSVRNHSVDL